LAGVGPLVGGLRRPPPDRPLENAAHDAVGAWQRHDPPERILLAWHRGFERRADGGAITREKVSAEGGWSDLLETYARAV
jgi:hypothetical protein